jgi:hypothetical protein
MWSFSITKTDQLMPFVEISTIYSENQKTQINANFAEYKMIYS